jgi:tRNA-(ms[2]io[6]A)-hydroxylase
VADGKRRLPVLGGGPPDPGDLPEERPRGAWIVLGALAVFAVLVPLAMVTLAALRAMNVVGAGGLAVASLACVAASSAVGGYLVGRFGAKAGPREGALAGALAGVVMWALSRTPLGALILPVTVGAAWLGARRGRRARQPGDTLGG